MLKLSSGFVHSPVVGNQQHLRPAAPPPPDDRVNPGGRPSRAGGAAPGCNLQYSEMDSRGCRAVRWRGTASRSSSVPMLCVPFSVVMVINALLYSCSTRDQSQSSDRVTCSDSFTCSQTHNSLILQNYSQNVRIKITNFREKPACGFWSVWMLMKPRAFPDPPGAGLELDLGSHSPKSAATS